MPDPKRLTGFFSMKSLSNDPETERFTHARAFENLRGSLFRVLRDRDQREGILLWGEDVYAEPSGEEKFARSYEVRAVRVLADPNLAECKEYAEYAETGPTTPEDEESIRMIGDKAFVFDKKLKAWKRSNS